jgi:hypothetical protein
MIRKSMLVVVGSIAVIAFMGLPNFALAGEPIATCGAGGGVCNGSIESFDQATIQDDSGSAAGRVSCSHIGGQAVANNNSSTGSASFVFTGCLSNGFACNSTGAGSGEIKTASLTSHLIYLHPINGGATTDVGVLFTNISLTLSCAGGLVKKLITGSVIGQVANPQCNTAAASHLVLFEAGATTGSQRYTQITTSGTVFDLTSGSESADTTTSSQIGAGTINWNTGQSVTIDC